MSKDTPTDDLWSSHPMAPASGTILCRLDQLVAGKGTLGNLIYSDSEFYDDFAATMSAMRSIFEGISEGEGTVGRLVRDARLYDEATLLVEDARAAIDDLREASPITSFGSVLFGAF